MHKGPAWCATCSARATCARCRGTSGSRHCRYPTAGSASNAAEAQPFYVNSPFGIVLGHNGNLTNSEQLKNEMFRQDLRHINTNSDSEVLLNVLAHELEKASVKLRLDPPTIFAAVGGVHRRVRGAYAVVAMIAGYGVLAFRDPYGIRPAVIGYNETDGGTEYMVASESVALDALGLPRRCATSRPGEAMFIDEDGNFYSAAVRADTPTLNPCIFEFVYLARPDSVIDGISVYETRLQHGREARREDPPRVPHLEIDVVIPIPDSSRPSAMQLAHRARPAVPRRLRQEPLHRPHLHHAGPGDAHDARCARS